MAATLTVTAGGAYAVASLAPDASDLPVRMVSEWVQPLATANAASQTLPAPVILYRTDGVRSTDSADSLLARLGVSDPTAAAYLRTDAQLRGSVLGRTGRTVTAEADEGHQLKRLVVRWVPEDDGKFKRLVVERGTQGFETRIETADLSSSMRLSTGTIRSSLFAATDEVGLPDSVATQLAEIFSGDIDFHRALRKGDRFSVSYEVQEADGEPVRAGRVLSAEFVNAGKNYQALWFQEPGQKGAYYTPDGSSLKRAFLASPMEFSRVTSGFKMRFHPILQKWRAHLGVDYAAPTGTSVRSVGDGVVEFAGWQNGFGNVVFVKHGGANSTVYAHLSRISVKRGQSLSQGQHVGAVGSTGWATGPHLHFEFRVNGAHRDPLTLARQSESKPVTAAARPQFDRQVHEVKRSLSAAATIIPARAQ